MNNYSLVLALYKTIIMHLFKKLYKYVFCIINITNMSNRFMK